MEVKQEHSNLNPESTNAVWHIVLLYLNSAEFLAYLSHETCFISKDLFRKKLHIDFGWLSQGYETLEELQELYFEQLSLLDALELGALFPDLTSPVIPLKAAVAFGMLTSKTKLPDSFTSAAMTPRLIKSVLFSAHCHQSSDADLILCMQRLMSSELKTLEFKSTEFKSSELKTPEFKLTELKRLFRMCHEAYPLFYFTPSIITRAERISHGVQKIAERICSQSAEYLSADPLLYLCSLFPQEIGREQFLCRWPFWLEADKMTKKWMRPMLPPRYCLWKAWYKLENRSIRITTSDFSELFNELTLQHLFLNDQHETAKLVNFRFLASSKILVLTGNDLKSENKFEMESNLSILLHQWINDDTLIPILCKFKQLKTRVFSIDDPEPMWKRKAKGRRTQSRPKLEPNRTNKSKRKKKGEKERKKKE